MDAQELARQLVKTHEYNLREELNRSARDYGDPFNNGLCYVVTEVVELAYGFTTSEARKFIKMTVGEI